MHGILDQCTDQADAPKLPNTLAYDRLRIRQLQEDVQDIIYLRICTRVFHNLRRQRPGAVSSMTSANALSSSGKLPLFEYAIVDPSGDQLGHWSSPKPEVSCLRPDPSAFIT